MKTRFRASVLALLGIAAAQGQQHRISTFAGGAPPPTPIAAVRASIGFPGGVAVDRSGNLYLSSINNCVFKVDSNGVMSRVSGDSRPGYSGDGGPATSAQLNNPGGLAIDSSGNLYIADTGNDRIRKVSVTGIITTVAGNGVSGYSGDGGPAGNAQLSQPSAVAADAAGNLYVADYSNSRIRKVSATGTITTAPATGSVATPATAVRPPIHNSGDPGVWQLTPPVTSTSLSD
jgi:hypothetical protein